MAVHACLIRLVMHKFASMQDGVTCLHVAQSRDIAMLLIRNGAKLDAQTEVWMQYS